MSKILRGILHRKTIDITEDLGMPEGVVVNLIVTAVTSKAPLVESMGSSGSPKRLPCPPPGWIPDGIGSVAGSLADE